MTIKIAEYHATNLAWHDVLSTAGSLAIIYTY